MSLSFSLCKIGTKNLPHGAVMRTKWDSQTVLIGGPGITNIIWMVGGPLTMDALSDVRLPPPGDVGVLRVPVTGGVQWLLPPGCRGFLLFAHRDQRPRTAGIQPPGVGAGDGRPRDARRRCHQVELWLSGVVTSRGLSWSFRLWSAGSWWSPSGASTITADTNNSPKSTTWTPVAHTH